MKKTFLSASIILLSAIGKNVMAQTDSAAFTLDPVTVTSSLVEKRSSETGRSISIIKGDDFSKLPVHSLDELLRYVPGVEVQARGPQGAQSDISMRGGTFQQVLVILDGVRLNDPNTGHFSAYIPIAPAEIERIEILKGASSAIYGSDAVGGVINIITKTFNAKKQPEGLQWSGQLGAGAYGLMNTNLGGFFKSGKLSVGAGLLTNHATGQPQRGTRGFFHNNTVSAGVAYAPHTHWNISYRAAFDDKNFSAQNFYTTSIRDTATEKITAWWHQARISFEKGNSTVSLDAGYKKLNDLYVFFPGYSPNDNYTKLLQALLLYRQLLGRSTSLVSGVNVHNKKIISNDRGTHQLSAIAPFVSLVQKLGDRFSIMPSLRLEWLGDLPAEFVPNLTASYKINNVQLRASGGKTIRDADFTERYNNYGKSSVPGGNRVGNPWLTMEESWGYEAGADWFLPTGIKISSSFFQRRNRHLIDWVQTAYGNMPRKENLVEGANYLLAKNISKLNTTGWETDIQAAPRLGGNHVLFLNAGFLWQYSSSTEAQPSFYISSHARFLTNFSVQYAVGSVALGFSGLYKNRQPQAVDGINGQVAKDYFVANAKASYGFLKNRWRVFVQADNIFNREYSDLPGAQMPRRWIQGGIQFSALAN